MSEFISPHRAAVDVMNERKRQIDAEGYIPAHDDEHMAGELAWAAQCYAGNAGDVLHGLPSQADYSCLPCWPWGEDDWKPKTPREDLVRAGALILAEIERIDRIAKIPGGAVCWCARRDDEVSPSRKFGSIPTPPTF